MNKKTGKITVKHVYAAQDAGLAVYPEGCSRTRWTGSADPGRRAARSTSRSRFNKTRVTSLDWVTLPDPALQGHADGHDT